jgi:hypothetical protein
MSLTKENNISIFVKNQFPEFYREEGQLFIAFIEAYYEFMGGAGQIFGEGNKLSNNRDIDDTIDDFIINFKRKYLSNVQFNTASNKKLFIKNALDFYRAKGTPRAVDLFFKLIYGLEARLYFPGDDVFKLSDNTWENQNYVELLPSEKNIQFVGQQVFGSTSGAVAFCERLVTVKKDNQYIDVLYLSGVTTTFKTNEQIETKNITDSQGNAKNITAKIMGSLTSANILFSSPNFVIGERLYVNDGLGKKAEAIVTGIISYIGIISFEVIDGGWGYSVNPDIISSERVFELNNVTFENTDYSYYSSPALFGERLAQDNVTLRLDPTANTDYSLFDKVYAYSNNDPLEANGVPIFEGTIVNIDLSSDRVALNIIQENYTIDSNNDIFLSDGTELFSNQITSVYTSSDSDGAGANVEIEILLDSNTAVTILDSRVEANVIAWANTMTIEYTGGDLVTGQSLYQKDLTNTLRLIKFNVANTFSNTISGQNYANIVTQVGYPRTNRVFIDSEDSSKTYNIVNLSNTLCGAISYNSDLKSGTNFYDFSNTYISATGFHSANNDSYSYNTQAEVAISTINEAQNFAPWYSSQLVGPELDVIIGGDSNGVIEFTTSIDYVNEGNEIEFANTDFDTAMTVSNIFPDIGTIETLILSNPGQGYSKDPFFVFKEPGTRHLERYDFYIKYTEEQELKSFQVGEIITTTTGNANAKARIINHNPVTQEIIAIRLNLKVDDYSEYDDFRNGDIIVGQNSNVAAEIQVVDERRMHARTGMNANVLSPAFNGEGFVTDIQFINSGFGYFGRKYRNGVLEEGELLNLVSFDDSARTIQAEGFLGEQGRAPGLHPNRKSFLSSDKYLHDNDYYQEYSYEILTALPFDVYKDTLIEVLHVAGTKPFGSFVATSESIIDIDVESSTSEFEIQQYPLFINEQIFFSNTAITTT